MLPLVNDTFETLRPYVPGKPVAETEREQGITGVIKLASNENCLGPSKKAIQAVQRALKSMADYPDGDCFYLRRGVADFLGIQPECLVFGNGTNEIIEMLVRTCMRPGENMVYTQGSFIVYKLCAMAADREIHEVPLRQMRFDLDAMLDAINGNTKLLFIANPNNPTGTYVSHDEVVAFLKRVPEHVIVVLDEAYFEYVTALDYPNGLDLLRLRKRLMVLRTFSKAYGLAGLRVGYGVAEPVLIDFINRGRAPFNVNSLAQAGALAALGDAEHVQRSRDLNTQEMARLMPRLRTLGIEVWPSQANFVFVDFGRNVSEVFERLLQRGVIIRPMEVYGFPQGARITIGTQQQNDQLVDALGHVLD